MLDFKAEADSKNEKTSKKQANSPKKEKPKKLHFFSVKFFEYLGDEPYILKDLSGLKIKILKNEVVILPDDERSDYLKFKKTLFKELDLKELI